MGYKAIDVSSWNGKPDWKKVAQDGVKIAVLRVTQHNDNDAKDESFEHNLTGCRANGIRVGVYKFSYAMNRYAMEAEAKSVVDALAGRGLDLPVFLDLEYEKQKELPVWELSALIDVFRQIVEKAGYKVAIYCNVDWYRHVIPSDVKKAYDFWLAAYPYGDDGTIQERLRPVEECIAWQYSSKGKVYGINGVCDMDDFYTDFSGTKQPVKKSVSLADAKELTRKLLKHYPFVYCPTLAGMTANKTPHRGDVVLFYRNGDYAHTGLVYKVEGNRYYTIEGNTSGASGVIANGGGVCKKSYSTSEYPGTKFYRPDYSLVGAPESVINKLIATAEAEIGYLEKRSNSNLDSKTGNAGSNNYTKYWRDIKPDYQGQPWCACFVTWCMVYSIYGSTAAADQQSGGIFELKFDRVIRCGDTGNDVLICQIMLRGRSYRGADGKVLKRDKIYGPNMKHAVGNFQREHGLVVDYEIGPKTLAKLFNI